MKQQILASIGEAGLRPGAAVNAALAADDRLKYAICLPQMAMDHAEHPHPGWAPSRRKALPEASTRRIAGPVIAGAAMAGADRRIPQASEICARIPDDLRPMAAPALPTGTTAGLAKPVPAMMGPLPAATYRLISPAAITQAGHDSPHQLLLDLHNLLNATQADLAEKILDGAAVCGITAADQPQVAAFMAGLYRAAPPKFDHPGFDTTGARAAARLWIQIDIGTADAQALVIHVDGGNGDAVFMVESAPATERPDALLEPIAGWHGRAAA
ncbi:hypothetical protein [Plastoroseomonas arctica]|uniref:Uncharacterized protein n=1 Tax=Plastoroseomonas arctica TaxID=1509237 RepID=A0AAF1KMN9_9PROT|nr:hypothetical protein [Plastoroseomonas arctica]MBR0653668.1 hypothetical protein [Plastoroseomonas arctica]